MAPHHTRWTYSDAHKDLWLEFHRGLEAFPDYQPGEEMEALEWATRINDPGLRRSVSRGAFRRLLARFPAEAKAFLNSGLPHDDLKSDFLSILSETP